MVLVDTSVWIRFLQNRDPYASELDQLLDREEVTGHDFVYGELLIGHPGSRLKLLASYEKMPRAHTIPHAEVVDFVHHRKLSGRGVGWVDIHLLASALVEGLVLWTADPRFASVASELGIGYQPSKR